MNPIKRGFVVFTSRDIKRMYLGDNDAWFSDLDQARLFPIERDAQHAVKRSEVATGHEPYERALARESKTAKTRR